MTDRLFMSERLCRVCSIVKLVTEYYGRDTVCVSCTNTHYPSRAQGRRQQAKRDSYDRRRSNYLVYQAKRRAQKSGLPYDLDDHVRPLADRLALGCCEMTGIAFAIEGSRSWDSPSLDRIRPEEGYVYSNVRWVLDMMNMAMGRAGEDRLRQVMSTWLNKSAA